MNIKCSGIKMDLSILNKEVGALNGRLQIFFQYVENWGKIQLIFYSEKRLQTRLY